MINYWRGFRLEHARASIGFSLVLLAVTGSLSGCSSYIEILQPDVPTPLPVTTVVPEKHALAILGVDVDAEADYIDPNVAGSVNLMVAVGNEGLADQKDIAVSARLIDPAVGDQGELMDETVTLESLKAGEVRVVSFMQEYNLPYRDHYQLAVEIAPVAGELDTSDNYRTYEIVIHNDE